MSNYGGFTSNSGINRPQAQKNVWNKNAVGPFPPFAVRFCSEYARNPDYSCDGNCKKLHVCRRWVAGFCREGHCRHAHSLLLPQNVRVLSGVGIKVTSQGCHDKVRRLLRCLFPQVCYSYNTEEGCRRDPCNYLHICRDLILNGYCQLSSHKKCRYNHAVSDDQTMPILQKFGVTWGSQREIQALYFDFLVADSPRFQPDCKCANCSANRPTRNASESESENDGSVTDHSNYSYPSQGNSLAGKSSPTFGQLKKASSNSPAYPSESPFGMSKSSSKVDDFSKLKLGDALRSGNVVPRNKNDHVGLMTTLVAYLIDNTLVVPAELVARYFDISANDVPTFIKTLLSSDAFDAAFRSKLPSTFDWNGGLFVSLLNVVRICIYQYEPGGCRDTRCQLLHVCKAFVSNVCTDPLCRYSHDLFIQPVFTKLGCDSYAIDRRMALIRVSHPNVCAAYNYAPAGCNDANCVNLHVCNDLIMGIPCSTPNCMALKDHNPTSSGINARNLIRYGLTATKREVVAKLVLPTVPPPPLLLPINLTMRLVPSSSASSFSTSNRPPAPPSQQSQRQKAPLPETNVLASALPNIRTTAATEIPPQRMPTVISKQTIQTIPIAAASIIINNPGVQHEKQFSDDLKKSDLLTVCERNLRGMCDIKKPVHDGMIHFEHPFCWVYKLPPADEATLMQYAVPDARIFVTADNARWVAFADKDNIIMEKSFCTPDIRLLNRTIELSEPYPFAGDSEIVFANNRGDAPFRMGTRIKQLVGQKMTASSQGMLKDADEPTFRLSKQIEIEVRCFRTPSLVSLTPVCAYSTKWCWYFKNRDTENYEETWTKCDELVGQNAGEIEYAYTTDCTTPLVLPAKEFCRPGGAADATKYYTFDFDTLLVSCDEDNLQTDLCSRPIDCFCETE